MLGVYWTMDSKTRWSCDLENTGHAKLSDNVLIVRLFNSRAFHLVVVVMIANNARIVVAVDRAAPLPKLLWLDRMKAIALLWIVLNHVIEPIFGAILIGWPTKNWPPLAARLAQLQPVDQGIWSIPVNALRYLGWMGDQGVALLLILSGFGLTWGVLQRYGHSALPLKPFLHRRLSRLYPLWWMLHAVFIAMWLITGQGLSLTDFRSYFSISGLRLWPSSFFYFESSWWFVTLLIQLYCAYPLLWYGVRRWGAGPLLAVSCLVGWVLRAFGFFFWSQNMNLWHPGLIFLCRLPEFSLGIALAVWVRQHPQQVQQVLRDRLTQPIMLITYALGMLLSVTRLGNVFSPFVLGLSGFTLIYLMLQKVEWSVSRPWSWLSWVGQHSYSIYLVHNPIMLPATMVSHHFLRIPAIVLAFALSLVAAIALERATDWITGVIQTQLVKLKPV
jgi:peptidoglycan/LPS O-acetylase OafA/YrhL